MKPVAVVAVVLVVALSMVAASDQQAEPVVHKATHQPGGAIGLGGEAKFSQLTSICLDGEGNLLAADMKAKAVLRLSGEGKVLATLPVGFGPNAVLAGEGGAVYVGGTGKLAKLDKDGKVVKTVSSADGAIPETRVAGLAASGADVFVSFGMGGKLGVRGVIVRFDRDLGQPKLIVSGLSCCCQRLAIAAREGMLYAGENGRFRVVRYDREGKELSAWGSGDRKGIDAFGSCCNPMGLCFGPGGELYTAEAGLDRIKRYDVDGKFLGLVGNVQVPKGAKASSCYNTAIAVSADGKRVFVQDEDNNAIHILAAPDAPAGESGSSSATPKGTNP